ncbi:alpha/beta hydrolase [Spirulina subsalsa FACHB-351]|uniref:Alpha/beta hydrolase n=1 Tax=Spirulina subsalsa FACHB-351 TaxID=234711 RepID=A0ABT3L317_9CYAN|nr:alpha/beta hydrolase [Spirulina subsalsa]MCW6035898.1 alpha/beta hydrolase [Spirulina subsalsa FACHB-351]
MSFIDEIVILLHGFNKGPDDMMPLASRFKELGYESIVPRLPTLFGSLEDCVSSLEIQLFDVISDCRSFFIVAHSMGGLIAESYLLKNPSEKLSGKVYICSPFGGTRLAKIGFRLPI